MPVLVRRRDLHERDVDPVLPARDQRRHLRQRHRHVVDLAAARQRRAARCRRTAPPAGSGRRRRRSRRRRGSARAAPRQRHRQLVERGEQRARRPAGRADPDAVPGSDQLDGLLRRHRLGTQRRLGEPAPPGWTTHSALRRPASHEPSRCTRSVRRAGRPRRAVPAGSLPQQLVLDAARSAAPCRAAPRAASAPPPPKAVPSASRHTSPAAMTPCRPARVASRSTSSSGSRGQQRRQVGGRRVVLGRLAQAGDAAASGRRARRRGRCRAARRPAAGAATRRRAGRRARAAGWSRRRRRRAGRRPATSFSSSSTSRSTVVSRGRPAPPTAVAAEPADSVSQVPGPTLPRVRTKRASVRQARSAGSTGVVGALLEQRLHRAQVGGDLAGAASGDLHGGGRQRRGGVVQPGPAGDALGGHPAGQARRRRSPSPAAGCAGRDGEVDPQPGQPGQPGVVDHARARRAPARRAGRCRAPRGRAARPGAPPS